MPRYIPICAADFLMLTLATVLQTHAQSVLRPGPVSASGAKYRLSGTVMNSVSGEPISRALVQLYASRPRSVLTDHEGRFEFEGLPEMGVSLNVRKPGYFSSQELRQTMRWQNPVRIGPNTAPLVLKLTPEAVIVGHVYDANGEPVEGVPIRINEFRVQNGLRQWQRRGGPHTNDDGEFRAANLLPGQYYVSAGPARDRNIVALDSAQGQAYPVVYYPAATERSAATPIALAVGQHVELDFTVKLVPTYMVSGIVAGYPPGRGVNLRFANESEDDISLVRVNPQNGSFEARVNSGLYTIKADAQDGQGHALYAERRMNVAADTSGIHLQLAPAQSIPVVVQMQATKPAPVIDSSGADRGKIQTYFPVSLNLISMDRAHSDVYLAPSPNQTHLSALLDNVREGKYLAVVTSNNPSWYVQSVTHGTKDLLRDLLVVTSADSQPIDIVLRDDPATLTATLQSGQASDSDSLPVLLVVPDRAPLAPKVFPGMGREYRMSGLAPGEYKIFAFESIDELEYMNPESLEPYVARTAQTTLQPDQKASVRVDLIQRVQ